MVENIIIAVFTSWPVPAVILLSLFLWLFKKEIGHFIKHRLKKAGPSGIEAESSAELQIEESNQLKEEKEKMAQFFVESGIKTYADLETWVADISNTLAGKDKALQEKDKDIKTHKDLAKVLLERLKIYEFAYLSLFLVYNSKLALLWFQQKYSVTKELFISTFPLPSEIQNASSEKEAIFSTLLSNGLIKREGDSYSVTEKGKDFLKYVGFLKNEHGKT